MGHLNWIGHVSLENESITCMHDALTSADNSETVSRRAGVAIYVPSKQLILLIGGYDDVVGFPPSSDLWIFSLPTQKWRKTQNIQFEGYLFGAVLTSNERYIVLLGGINDHKHYVDDIFVLDIKNEDDSKWKLRKSTVKCPKIGRCKALRTGGIDSKDDILINGFIKDCFKMKEFKNIQLPPSYIMKIISMWYDAEMIHWLNCRYDAVDH